MLLLGEMVRKEEVEEMTHTIQSLLKELGELKAAKEKTTREYMQVLAENIAKDDEIEQLNNEMASKISEAWRRGKEEGRAETTKLNSSEQEAGNRMRVEGRKIPSSDQAYGLPRDPMWQKSIDGMKKRGEGMKN